MNNVTSVKILGKQKIVEHNHSLTYFVTFAQKNKTISLIIKRVNKCL